MYLVALTGQLKVGLGERSSDLLPGFVVAVSSSKQPKAE